MDVVPCERRPWGFQALEVFLGLQTCWPPQERDARWPPLCRWIIGVTGRHVACPGSHHWRGGGAGSEPAVSSDLGSWLHSGFPRAVGWVVLVSLCLYLEWGWGVRWSNPEVPSGSFVEGGRPAKWTAGGDLTSLEIEPNRTWNLGSQAPTSPREDRGMGLFCCVLFS